MKKILIIGAILLAICISISAVSADDSWSFNFSSSESSNSEGGAFSLNTVNNLLQIQGLNYTIPEEYKENESFRAVGEDANLSSLPENSKITCAEFINGNDSIIIKTFFHDQPFDEDGYTPAKNAVKKEIADQEGWLEEYEDGVTFDFVEDGKIVEIFAPDEKVLETILKSTDD